MEIINPSASDSKPERSTRDGDAPLSFIHSTLDEAGLDLFEFRVYARVLRVSSGSGVCWQSIATMAKACGIHHSSARRALGSLEQRGMLQRIDRPGQTTHWRPRPPSQWTLPLRSDRRGSVIDPCTRNAGVPPPTPAPRPKGLPPPPDRTPTLRPQGTPTLRQEGTPTLPVEGKLLPGSSSLEVGEGSAPAGSSKPGAVATVAGFPPPPRFGPVPRGYFRKEYLGLIQDAEAEIARIRNLPGARERVLKREAKENIRFLLTERPTGWADRVKQIEGNPASYAEGPIRMEVTAITEAWSKRIIEIKAVMNGVTNPSAAQHLALARTGSAGRPPSRNDGTYNDGDTEKYRSRPGAVVSS